MHFEPTHCTPATRAGQRRRLLLLLGHSGGRRGRQAGVAVATGGSFATHERDLGGVLQAGMAKWRQLVTVHCCP